MRYVLKAGFGCIRKTIFSGLSLFGMRDSWVLRLSRSVNFYRSELIRNITHARSLKALWQERLQEVEARIMELQAMQRSLQRLNDACCGTAHSSVYCSILEALEQGAQWYDVGLLIF
ncbi:Zn(II)-responsive regulator [Salmonella bongori]|nr:Zn(II)-responsive regulator [Salmonella bongori]